MVYAPSVPSAEPIILLSNRPGGAVVARTQRFAFGEANYGAYVIPTSARLTLGRPSAFDRRAWRNVCGTVVRDREPIIADFFTENRK